MILLHSTFVFLVTQAGNFLRLPFLDQIFTRSASMCLFSQPFCFSPQFPCPCPPWLLSVLMGVVPVGLLTGLPVSSLSSPPVFCSQNYSICKSNRIMPCPPGMYQRFLTFPPIPSRLGLWPSAVRRLTPTKILTSAASPPGRLRISVKGLGKHSKTCAIWPHSDF